MGLNDSMTWPWPRQKVKLRKGVCAIERSNPKAGVGQILKLYLEYFSSYKHFSKLKRKLKYGCKWQSKNWHSPGELISPAPWQPRFLMNHDDLNNLCRRSPKEHFCKIILKSVQWFLTRRFLKFSIYIYRENKPHPPGGHVFWWIQMAWTILV